VKGQARHTIETFDFKNNPPTKKPDLGLFKNQKLSKSKGPLVFWVESDKLKEDA